MTSIPIDLRLYEIHAAKRGELRLIVRAVRPQPEEVGFCRCGKPHVGAGGCCEQGTVIKPVWPVRECGQPVDPLAEHPQLLCRKRQGHDGNHVWSDRIIAFDIEPPDCPWPVGTELWGRETYDLIPCPCDRIDPFCGYCDGRSETAVYKSGCSADVGGWRSSITMPRWASRFDPLGTVKRVEARRVEEMLTHECIKAGMGTTYRPGYFYGDQVEKDWDAHARPGEMWADNCWCWMLGI